MRQKQHFSIWILVWAVVFACSWAGSAVADEAGSPAVSFSLNGERLDLGNGVLEMKQGVLYMDLSLLTNVLDGNMDWQDNRTSASAAFANRRIQFGISGNECQIDGRVQRLGGDVFVSSGRIMVPLRSVCALWGISVDWNQEQHAVDLNVPGLLQAERLYDPAIPARIAFINHRHLFIMAGNIQRAEPVLVSRVGEDELIGWSSDGRWLAYLHSPVREGYSGEQYLWAVKADGSGTVQIDLHPIYRASISNAPVWWSPKTDTLAYLVRESADSYEAVPGVRTASFRDGEWVRSSIESKESDSYTDLAWAPDGESLAVCIPVNKAQGKGMRIDRLSLSGQSSPLLAFKPTDADDPEGPWSASAMKWSPDGHYLAYYLIPQSASMAADGARLQVMAIGAKAKTVDLGSGLAYGQWLAWSEDSSRLAYIEGIGRDVVSDKKLGVAEMNNQGGTVYGGEGQVDMDPVWIPGSHRLLFCRGAENTAYAYGSGRLLVPGQRIEERGTDGETSAVTSGGNDSADCAPTVSAEGKDLMYLRLSALTQGNLRWQSLQAGQEVSADIVSLDGEAGYYGNYLPRWFDVYWMQ